MKTIFTKFKNFFLFVLIIGYSFLSANDCQAQVGINTTDPKSTFEVNGSIGQTVTTITASTTLDATHNTVICNNGSTAITVTLPSAVGITGRIYNIKKEVTSTANVTIATTASQTIDGAPSVVLKNTGDATTVFSNGAHWKTISNSNSPSAWSINGNTGTNSASNYVGTTDATDLTIKTNATSRVNITSAGVTTIGDATNHTKIEADGTLVLVGTATVFDDLKIFPDATSRGGSNSPAWGGSGASAFKNNGGSQGVFLWMFSYTTEQEVYFSIQMPHGYKSGSDIFPHVHWTTAMGTPSGTNVVWGLEYTVAAIGVGFPTTTSLTSNSVIALIGTPIGTGQHLITSLGAINGSSVGLSTVIVCRLYRATANSNDTFSNEVGLLSVDFHYEIDTIGSRSEFEK